MAKVQKLKPYSTGKQLTVVVVVVIIIYYAVMNKMNNTQGNYTFSQETTA